MNQDLFARRRSGCNLIAFLQQNLDAHGLRVGVAVNGAESLADRNFIADCFVHDDADGGVDRIFFAFASSAEDDTGSTNVFAVDRRDISGLWTRHKDVVIGARQASWIVDRADVASL